MVEMKLCVQKGLRETKILTIASMMKIWIHCGTLRIDTLQDKSYFRGTVRIVTWKNHVEASANRQSVESCLLVV
jgi:hypothetical protein